MIDLVVENLGGGLARDLTFSQPLPSQCWGIEEPNGEGGEVLGEGLAALAAGQRIVFDAGQYGGLEARLGNALEVKVSYRYRNPVGFNRKRTESCVLTVSYIRNMPTRISADQAIVEALKGPNKTTVQGISTDLHAIRLALEQISRAQGVRNGGTDA